ncbi:winged helix-turn-helix transcriptional regulator [Chryseobacterium gossypii]|uniref:winged helix-turn-helix transcriptional regulator n=1 Tax=Chryseobacterium gossypii TaxID=3231602 RepID=UPI0035266381
MYTNNLNVSFIVNQIVMDKEKTEKIENKCELQKILDIIGGKWSMSIIYALIDGKKRFKELERMIPGISTRMLVKELKNMEENDIVIRKAFATVPPTVEYSLTVKGRKLEPIIIELQKWGLEYGIAEN